LVEKGRRRQSHAHLPQQENPPSEPTSTIVLTSPQNRFVDIRLLLPLGGDDGGGGGGGGAAITHDWAKLDWAIAGTSSRDTTQTPVKATFKHWVDSRYVDADNATDEGLMRPSETDPTEVIESGEMVNFATGRVEQYEECWVDGLPSGEGEDGDIAVAGWVLVYEEGDKRGMMVRIGERVQGCLRIGEQTDDTGFGAVRWTHVPGSSEKGHTVAAMGLVSWFPEKGLDGLKDGDIVTSSMGQKWTCVETW
jgi:hypothetical protein